MPTNHRRGKNGRAATETPGNRCAFELGKILDEDGAIARTLREKFERSRLHHWRRGKIPDLRALLDLRDISKGKLRFEGWLEPAPPPPPPCEHCGREG